VRSPNLAEVNIAASKSTNRRKGGFAADVLKLTSGTVVAQLVSVFAAPLVTRLFSPQAFGIAALFSSITGILAIVVCLRYDRSIVVPAQDEDGFNLLAVSLGFTLLVTLLCVPLELMGAPLLLRWLNAPGLEHYLWLVPLTVFCMGVSAALYSWNTRKRHFTLITIAGVLTSASYVVFSIMAGAVGYTGAGSLIVGAFLGIVLSALVLLIATWRECWPGLVRTVNLQQLRKVVYRYRRFPKYSTGAAILNTISWELPSFFLAGFFSTAIVGQYALGNRLIRLPMSFIGQNISKVFSQRAAEARHQGTLGIVVERTFQSLVNVGMFPFLLVVFMGKDLFTLVFGIRWAEAGVFTEILSLWAFFWFASAPLSSVLDVLDEQAFELRMNVLIVATRLLSLVVGGYMGNARLALALFSASGVLVYGYYMLAILKKCGVALVRPLRTLLSQALKFVPCAALMLVAEVLKAPSVVIVALSGILLASYYLLTIRHDSELCSLIYPLMRRRSVQQVASQTVN
jgi:lipopolysaccharide exporter